MIMALRLAVLKSVFSSYDTKAYSLIFLFLAIIYLIIKDKKYQRNLLIYEIFGILLLVTPFIGNKIVTIGAGKEANWPVYGILCAIPLTAYAVTELWKQVDTRKEKYTFVAVFMLVMQLGLGHSLTGVQFGLPQNLQKTTCTTEQIAELLGDEEWHVMAPVQVSGEIRQYAEEIRVFYNTSYEDMQKDLKLLQNEAAYYGCNCIILEECYDDEEVMQKGGYQKMGTVARYMIYRRADL